MNTRLAALEFITGCLSVWSMPATEDALRSAIASENFNWQIVIKLANAQRITPALWVALKNRGLVESLPVGVREYFRQSHRLNTLRNQHLRARMLDVARQLNVIGVEPLLLKGGISLFIDTFDDPGCRMMGDLDFLVPQGSTEECWNILHTLGYIPLEKNSDDYYSNHHHSRPLYRPGEYGLIEIHREALPKSASRILPTQLLWNNIEPFKESGVTIRVPNPTYRVLHNLLHSELVNRTYARGEISLRSLHELVRVQAVYNERIDWKTIWLLMESGRQVKILLAWLYLAHRLLGNPLPSHLHPTIGTVIHYSRTRLQARWAWTEELVNRVLWFSAKDICEHYNCSDSTWSLATGRIRLATYLSYKYGIHAFNWVGRQFSKRTMYGIW